MTELDMLLITSQPRETSMLRITSQRINSPSNDLSSGGENDPFANDIAGTEGQLRELMAIAQQLKSQLYTTEFGSPGQGNNFERLAKRMEAATAAISNHIAKLRGIASPQSPDDTYNANAAVMTGVNPPQV